MCSAIFGAPNTCVKGAELLVARGSSERHGCTNIHGVCGISCCSFDEMLQPWLHMVRGRY